MTTSASTMQPKRYGLVKSVYWLCEKEARELHATRIGTEHLLTAMLCGIVSNPVADELNERGITYSRLSKVVERMDPSGDHPESGLLPSDDLIEVFSIIGRDPRHTEGNVFLKAFLIMSEMPGCGAMLALSNLGINVEELTNAVLVRDLGI